MRALRLFAVAAAFVLPTLSAAAAGVFADDSPGAVTTPPACPGWVIDRGRIGGSCWAARDDGHLVYALAGDPDDQGWRSADGGQRMFEDGGMALRAGALHRDDGWRRVLYRETAEREGGLHWESAVRQ